MTFVATRWAYLPQVVPAPQRVAPLQLCAAPSPYGPDACRGTPLPPSACRSNFKGLACRTPRRLLPAAEHRGRHQRARQLSRNHPASSSLFQGSS
ncbi:hypothetical protein NDU88_003994 [Pleurodeles waltl]|uniref:Uncharacterized protein n=1 Tax=Pleurodeles waltl TaxID=8319 RepID=A0AAV7NMA9_PLEWA|nr:hypothetical protein NDU88_003994 [Pleurodeles waltl]